MSKQAKRRQHRHSARPTGAAPFTPVPVRARHDGWTPARQILFVKALAACACVEEACAAVGISPKSFYRLRSRPDAGSFRQAVDAALDVGVHRLAEAMMGRALHGEVTPIFYKGEQVGEKRRYDNRLAMFILRTRAPERYGKWRDTMQQHREHPDGAALMLARALRNLAEDATADAAGRPRPQRPLLKMVRLMDDPAEQAAVEEERERAEDARREAALRAYRAELRAETSGDVEDFENDEDFDDKGVVEDEEVFEDEEDFGKEEDAEDQEDRHGPDSADDVS